MRGATFKYLKFMELLGNFNSRSRAGSDFRQLTAEPFQDYFNSRSRAGSDVWCVATLLYLERFQFTLPCGERLTFLFKIFLIYYFNSRSRAGSDKKAGTSGSLFNISIHAPVRGTTTTGAGGTGEEKDFNSRSRAGSDMSANLDGTLEHNISIHAPVRGATLNLVRNLSLRQFQFTLPCGERLFMLMQ